jgi:hypothetical protein
MSGDLFGHVPPAPAERQAPAQHRPWPSDAECRVKERALRPFIAWLCSASLETLTAASAADLAAKFPPIEAADIQQMLDVRMRSLARKR